MSGKYRGFTLVELMVTVAVAAILLSVGVPSLKSLYDGYRVRSEISRIEQSLAFARNQAVSYGMTVFVCAYASDGVCGSDWHNGILVYAVDPDDHNKTLKVVEGFNSSDTVKGSNISFRPDGLSDGAATFIYCPDSSNVDSRSVTVSTSGMIKYGATGLSCS
ncbi:GspH/FimT family pseudopilin [Shewanella dokdonensis]|uniref:Type II secretion system protein H n=1 Tax=Shewanella dokdonensis TaxID=712036 RepID=A0ABX8DGP7_9GAMM|nr:GspH/FimT family pseudopilin [Shewanella dokdonensis]MCL1074178.1 GspH/FimT family pseudopilin [Shewanella dokdonensis]QVK23898.1 GspH/FimT family pseudopilin [Shewanella dokdonensis]